MFCVVERVVPRVGKEATVSPQGCASADAGVVGGAPEEMGAAPSTEDPEGYSRMTRHALENLCAGRHIQFTLDLKSRQRHKLIEALIKYDREHSPAGGLEVVMRWQAVVKWKVGGDTH